ncbi:DUF6541 family protein [Sinomonas sp. JGH33]|uniref:DUF6541 family protein n=1 Tax=Sinomonas terricola TaxID=3110330 RepID=A0ABU5T0A5_9MICC|nr:DUF6541 family protein [Sinomonas sp. JGH33]MEA5453093.1 DUF6541 family protein [Sinomonas sp. JGH33]
MSWWQTAPSVLVAILVFLLPGLGFAYAVKVRGLSRLLLAPLFTVALAGVATLALPVLRLPWRPLTFAATSLVLIAVAWIVRRLIDRRWPESVFVPVRRSSTRAAWAGLAVGVLLVASTLVWAIGAPDNISQTYDNVFHLNAIEWAIESGNASPLSLGAFTGISAYPAAWHAFVALVAELSGVSVPVAVSATTIAIGAVAWPLSAMYFVQMVCGPRVAVNLLAGLFSASYSAFPLLMVDWGVLYPNLLSIAVLPAALGLGVSALGLGRLHRPSAPVAWILFLLSLPAVALAHPSTLMAILVFLLPAFVAVYTFRLRALAPFDEPRARLRAAGLTSLLLFAAFSMVVLWRVFRPPAGSADWAPVESSAQVVGEIFLSAQMGRPAAVIVGLCLVVGLVHLWRSRSRRWLLGLFLVASVLFFYAAGLNASPRWFLTGVWYFDSYRLAALMPTASLPLAVIGGVFVWDSARRSLTSASAGGRLDRILRAVRLNRRVAMSGCGVVTVLLVVGTQYGITTFGAEQARHRYVMTENAPLLSNDERTLLERLPGEVPPDDVIAGMPSNGSSLAFAYSHRHVVQPHILTTHGTDVDLVNAGLKSADTIPEVCPAIKALNVKWVLDFGTRAVTGTLPGYGGVIGLDGSNAVSLADSQGDAKLYRVTACWR